MDGVSRKPQFRGHMTILPPQYIKGLSDSFDEYFQVETIPSDILEPKLRAFSPVQREHYCSDTKEL